MAKYESFSRRRFLIILVLLIILYISTISISMSNGNIATNYSVMMVNENIMAGNTYHVTLESIDYKTGKISFEIETNAPTNLKKITKCVQFGGQLKTLDGYTGWISSELVHLIEINRGELSYFELPSEGWTSYMGKGISYFDTDLTMFPFDSIKIDIDFVEDCFKKDEVNIDGTKAKVLYVKSKIPDYSLYVNKKMNNKQNNTRFYFQLKRNNFLIFMTLFILSIAFISSVIIVYKRKNKKNDWSLLTYFIGLWAIRDIILDPIQNIKPFPTFIEVTVIFLFCFTIIGIDISGIKFKKS